VLKRYRRQLEFALLLLLAVALLWWFGRGLDWSLVKGALQQSDWRLILLAWVIVLAAYAWRAMRWGSFLAPLCKASARELWVATTIGFGAILLVGRAGEVVRPVVLPMRDRRVRPAAAFVTIMIERVYDFMAVSLIFALSLLWFRPAAASVNDFHRVRIAGVLILGVCITGIAGLVLFRLKSDTIIRWVESRLNRWSRIPFKARKAVLSLLDQLARALRILTSARELAVTIGWTALLWGSVIFTQRAGLSDLQRRFLFWDLPWSARRCPLREGQPGPFMRRPERDWFSWELRKNKRRLPQSSCTW